MDMESSPISQPSTTGANQKKTLLQQLIAAAMGSGAGRSIHETISNIKNAMGAYKNYAKEWDNLNGGGTEQPSQQSAPKPQGMPMGQTQGSMPQDLPVGQMLRRSQPQPPMPPGGGMAG